MCRFRFLVASWSEKRMSSKRRGFENLRTFSRLAAIGAAAAFALATPAIADLSYKEGPKPDLSNSGLAPTVIDLALGDNIIEGRTGRDNGVIDRDYFTFTLLEGEALSQIIFTNGTNIGLSFIGVQAGNQLTVDPAAAVATGLLGWYHYSSADLGTDLLDNMGMPLAGSTGFTGPLGPGTYTFWVQEASPGPRVSYRFNFIVSEFISAVPEPSTWAMMLLGFGAVGMAVRRNRRRTLEAAPA
jgi:hypothetical protein